MHGGLGESGGGDSGWEFFEGDNGGGGCFGENGICGGEMMVGSVWGGGGI